MKEDHYKNLGVGKDATTKEIKKAFRKKAIETHPDKSGTEETRDQFIAVQNSYLILSNPRSRKRYDETGQDGTNLLGAAEQFTLGIFSSLIDKYMNTGAMFNFIDTARATVEMQRDVSIENTRKAEKLRGRLEKLRGRVSVDGENNLYNMLLEEKSRLLENQVINGKDETEMLTHALKIIALYKDGFIDRPFASSTTNYTVFRI